ncbi:MAG: hypothetical protein ACTHMZ_01145 [Actinomycetes bacterium]
MSTTISTAQRSQLMAAAATRVASGVKVYCVASTGAFVAPVVAPLTGAPAGIRFTDAPQFDPGVRTWSPPV